MKNKLYPLKFQPIVKEKVWGGEKLKTILQKKTDFEKTGESWEISAIENSVSKVINGKLKNHSLTELLAVYKEDLVGKKVYQTYGQKFPLLFKFLDAGQNLSLQLHPNDEIAKERHNSFGKSEMWYILQAEKNAGIYVGFIPGTTQQDYLEHLEKGNLEKIMNFEKVKPGDVFYIKPGLVHSIGKGVLLAEIQQSSDITYRLYDWNRKDLNGKPRELHTELALDAIDFQFDEFKIKYNCSPNTFQQLVKSKFYTTRKINLNKSLQLNYSETDSFVVFMCVKGEVEIKTNSETLHLNCGETAMIPASIKQLELQTTTAELLEITL